MPLNQILQILDSKGQVAGEAAETETGASI